MKESIEFSKTCECGCGRIVKPGNRYINNHYWFGKKHTEKTRNLQSEIKKCENNPFYGKKHTEETLRKQSEIKKGKKYSEKTKKLWSEQRKGKPLSEEHRKNMSESRLNNIRKGISVGENHYNWKGGITCEPYCPLWLDKEYKESIRERDNYQCQNPLCYGKVYKIKNHLHHINYRKKDCRPLNIITLCPGCNIRANVNRDFWEKFYTYKMKGILVQIFKDLS